MNAAVHNSLPAALTPPTLGVGFCPPSQFAIQHGHPTDKFHHLTSISPDVLLRDDEGERLVYQVTGSAYRDLLRLGKEYINLIKYLFQDPRGSSHKFRHYDYKQGLTMEEVKVVNSYVFNNEITVVDVTTQRCICEDSCRVNVNESTISFTNQQQMPCGCSLSADDVYELYHDSENRSLRISTVKNIAYDIQCYDQCTLRTIYYVILSRCSALQEAQDPLVTATNIVSAGYPTPQPYSKTFSDNVSRKTVNKMMDSSKIVAKGFPVSKTIGIHSSCNSDGSTHQQIEPDVHMLFPPPSPSENKSVQNSVPSPQRSQRISKMTDPLFISKGIKHSSSNDQLLQARARIANLEASLKARDGNEINPPTPQSVSPFTASESGSQFPGTPHLLNTKMMSTPLRTLDSYSRSVLMVPQNSNTLEPENDLINAFNGRERLPLHSQSPQRQQVREELVAANNQIRELERELESDSRNRQTEKNELQSTVSRIKELEQRLQSQTSSPYRDEVRAAHNRVKELEKKLHVKLRSDDSDLQNATKRIANLEQRLQTSDLDSANKRIQSLEEQVVSVESPSLAFKESESVDDLTFVPTMSNTLPVCENAVSSESLKDLHSTAAQLRALQNKLNEKDEQQDSKLIRVLSGMSKLENAMNNPSNTVLQHVLDRLSQLERTPQTILVSEGTSPNSSHSILKDSSFIRVESAESRQSSSQQVMLSDALTRLRSIEKVRSDMTAASDSQMRSNENSPSESQLLIKEALACIEASRSPSGTLVDSDVTDLLRQALVRIEHLESEMMSTPIDDSKKTSRRNSIIKQPQEWVTPSGKKVGFSTRKKSTYSPATHEDEVEIEDRRKTLPMLDQVSARSGSDISVKNSGTLKPTLQPNTALSSMQVSAATTPGSTASNTNQHHHHGPDIPSVSSVGSFLDSKYTNSHHHVISPMTESLGSRCSSRRQTISPSEVMSCSSVLLLGSSSSAEQLKQSNNETDDDQGPLLQELQHHNGLPEFRRASILNSAAKSLIIGCGNAEETSQVAQEMSSGLVQQGFLAEQCILAENISDSLPTKNNIMNALNWVLRDLPDEAAVFIAIIGQTSRDGSLIPYDRLERGVIPPEDLRSVVMDNLPQGCKLTIICDLSKGGELIPLPFKVAAASKGLCEQSDMVAPYSDPGVVVQVGATISDNATMFPGTLTTPLIQSLNASAGQSSVGSLLTSIADSFHELDAISPFVSSNKPLSSVTSFTLANDLPILHESVSVLNNSAVKPAARRRR